MANTQDSSKPVIPQACLHILELVRDLPPPVRSLLLPDSYQGMKRYEQRLERLRIRERTRASVMQLQRRFGLPLRPNAQLHEVVATVRIQLLKQERRPGDQWQPPAPEEI